MAPRTAAAAAAAKAVASRKYGKVAQAANVAQMFSQMAPNEIADPSIIASMQRRGLIGRAGTAGTSGFLNGGPLAQQTLAQQAVTGQPLASPASTGTTPTGLMQARQAGLALNEATPAAQAARAAAAGPANGGFWNTVNAPAAEGLTGETEAGAGAGAAGAGINTAKKTALTGWRGMLARTPFVAGQTAAASPWAAGTIGRAGLYAGAGYLGANLLHGVVGERDGTFDDATEGALKGAGIGAGIGSMVPVVGTGLGALAGGAIGGAWGFFTGDDSPKTQADHYLKGQFDATKNDSLVSILNRYNISPDTQQQLLVQIDALRSTLGSKAEAQALVQQVLSQIPALVQQDWATKQQAARAASLQSTIMPMVQEQFNNSRQLSSETAALMNSAAGQIKDPQLAAIYRAHAAQMASSYNNTLNAYAAQLALAPQMYGYGAANGYSTDPSAYAGPNATTAAYSPVG